MKQDSNQPLYFQCSMCGECCSSWNIPIEGEKARTLLALDWVKQRLADTRRELVPVSDDLYRLPLTDENVCVFLSEDRRCLVEANEGLALKPHECQRFPFATVKMPDGTVRHDSSAACKQVSEKLLMAFQPILPQPENDKPMIPAIDQGQLANDQLQNQPSFQNMDDWPAEARRQEALQYEALQAFPGQVRVGPFRKVSLADYEAYLAALHPVFSQPDVSCEAAVREANRLLKHLGSSCLDDRSDSEDSSPHPIESCPGDRASAGQGVQAQSLFCLFSSFIRHALVLWFLRKPYRSLTWFELLRGRQYHDPRIFGLPVDLQARRRIRWDAAHEHHLKAFLYNILQRRLPVARGHSLISMLAMAAVACLLVRWYAVTLAAIRQEGRASAQLFSAEADPPDGPAAESGVDSADVTGAIRLVERYYTGHQPRFMQKFHSPWAGWLLAKLLF